MYLLDTNVISEMRQGKMRRGNPNLAAWGRTVAADSLYLSVITLKEIELGILKAERSDPAKGMVFRTWMNQYIMPNYRDRILPVDLKIALRAAHLHLQRSRAVSDTMIAATAWAHGFTMVTRNYDDFHDTGVTVLDPFQLAV